MTNEDVLNTSEGFVRISVPPRMTESDLADADLFWDLIKTRVRRDSEDTITEKISELLFLVGTERELNKILLDVVVRGMEEGWYLHGIMNDGITGKRTVDDVEYDLTAAFRKED